jgi:hypothetical protein
MAVVRQQFGHLSHLAATLASLGAGQEAILAAVDGIADDVTNINRRLGTHKIDAAAAAAELKGYVADAAAASHADHEAVMAVVRQQFGHLSELQATVFPMLQDLKVGQAEIKAAVKSVASDVKDINTALGKSFVDQAKANEEIQKLLQSAAAGLGKELSAVKVCILCPTPLLCILSNPTTMYSV